MQTGAHCFPSLSIYNTPPYTVISAQHTHSPQHAPAPQIYPTHLTPTPSHSTRTTRRALAAHYLCKSGGKATRPRTLTLPDHNAPSFLRLPAPRRMVPAASAAATAAEDAKEVLQAARCFLEAASARAECACRSRRACRCPSSLAGGAAPLCCATVYAVYTYTARPRTGRGIPTVCVWSPKARCPAPLVY